MELNINAPLRVQTQKYFSLKHNFFKEAEERSFRSHRSQHPKVLSTHQSFNCAGGLSPLQGPTFIIETRQFVDMKI